MHMVLPIAYAQSIDYQIVNLYPMIHGLLTMNQNPYNWEK
jgi:hypothetical protein